MPPKKTAAKKIQNISKLAPIFKEGTQICDVFKKSWILENAIGQGGFGVIYSARFGADENSNSSKCVVKIEPFGNGPLFCEMNFYIRAAQVQQLETWRTNCGLDFVGVPSILGHGIYKHENIDYRFLVLPLLGKDLQALWRDLNCRFSISGACQAAVQCIDALEYIHSRKYSHADVKGANLLLDCNNPQRIFLVDFGLAECFTQNLSTDIHRAYKVDPKRRHNGTSDYCSRDAHRGVIASRRGDLEGLLWTVLEWISGVLPWSKCLENKDKVAELKEKVGKDPRQPLNSCETELPPPLIDFMDIVLKLNYEEKPDYDRLRTLLFDTVKCSGGDSTPGSLHLNAEAMSSILKRGRGCAKKKTSAVKKRRVVKKTADVASKSNHEMSIGTVNQPPPSKVIAPIPSEMTTKARTGLRKVRTQSAGVQTSPMYRSPRSRAAASPLSPAFSALVNHSPDLFVNE